jgi:hypothetical protein
MKKTKLVIDYEFDYDVLGITTSLKGYRLAWELNHRLGIHLVKQPDLLVGVKKGIEKGFTYFSYETPANRLKLLKNKCSDAEKGKYYLIPEFPRFDFIILARLNEPGMQQPLIHCLKAVPSLEWVTPVALNTLKSRSNFVF